MNPLKLNHLIGFIFITVISICSKEIVLQNGLNGYSGCQDAYIRNGATDVPTDMKNYNNSRLNCEYVHTELSFILSKCNSKNLTLTVYKISRKLIHNFKDIVPVIFYSSKSKLSSGLYIAKLT